MVTILGIDIGGSGIKGAPVDTQTGKLLAPRHRLPTPDKAKPDDIAGTVAEICRHFEWTGSIGCGFPAVVRSSTVMTAVNIHKSWIGVDLEALLARTTGCPVLALNDADAAGVAEMSFGAGRDRDGVVLIVTVGTGIGTSLFSQGQLVPNTELGHIEIKGRSAEERTSDAVRKREDLTWEKWTARFDQYLRMLEALLWPDLIVVGGGVSRKADRFLPNLKIRTAVVPAELENEAGIIGAALAADRFSS